jgi:tetratricopeptide (TPR) repeat protein
MSVVVSFRLTPVLALAALLGTAPAAGAQSITYLEAISAYSHGDRRGALAALATMSPRDISEQAKGFFDQRIENARLWLPRARTAVMMHTEAWFEGGDFAVRLIPNVHYDAARAIVRAIDRIRIEGGPVRGDPAFVRDWYLLTVSHLHGYGAVAISRGVLAEARRLFPTDPEVLLASGADHEVLSIVSTGFLSRYDPGGERAGSEKVVKEKELESAARYFRQALPMHEARVRLGHVLLRQGQLAAAAEELETARGQALQPQLRYLANVFLGLVETARDRRPRAIELFADALRIYPTGQTAQLAMSEAAYLDGRLADAAAGVTTLLQTIDKKDPWWTYMSGEYWHLEHRLTLLRKAARP